ncbi:S8/S53 family peptidase [Paraflavisolibacter caeni]|nr:S8 family peptidase [Paraflavisolibacter caeni]
MISFFFFLVSFAQKDTSRFRYRQLSVDLQRLISKKEKDSVEIVVAINKDSSLPRTGLKFRLLEHYLPANIIKIKVKQDQLEEVLKLFNPKFASISHQPKEELTTGSLDISLNKLNYAHSLLPEVNGEGVVISIKEQQFDSTDIDYQNRYFNSGRAANSMTTHASIMATIAAGAANSSPFAMGAAPASTITSSSFSSLLPDPDSVFQKYNITIQNHSYGTAVESFYGNEAFAYDVSATNNPGLLHVFSSGNSGDTSGSNGLYVGLKGYGNLTGNFKHAKNILTVGAVDSFNVVESRSSKGPAFDGRVKPELVAFGADGSSGAAAMVSGAIALVQQAYRNSHSGITPDAALVKAVIINSADDIGNLHVDYSSGYGSLNAWKAVSTVLENRILSDSVSSGASKTFPISIPAGVLQLKVTVAWTDVPAAPNAVKALVNDVDAKLLSPATNESWLPWVLSSFPHVDSLQRPAHRMLDTLNNVEQITIDHPQPGIYLLQVKGTRITTDRQKIFAAIQMDTANSFTWTFPSNGSQIIAGDNNILRWQTDLAGAAKLEYSYDGSNWQTISDRVSLEKAYYRWQAPDVMKKAILRMSVNSLPEVISDTFVISKQTRVQVGFNCEDSFLLYWNALPAISNYQIYRLGDQYLQPVTAAQDTFIVVQKSQDQSLFYAVAPVVDGLPGIKSYTINYAALGVGCYLRGFYVLEKTDAFVVLKAELGSLYNVIQITLQKRIGNNFVDVSSISSPLDLSFLFRDSTLVQGIQYYRLQLRLLNGAAVYSEIVPVFHFSSLPVVVYPNPVQQGIPVSLLTSEPGRYQIDIIDVQGRKVKEYKLQNQEERIPLILSKGIYFIRILSDEGKVGVQKLVVY